MNRPAHAPLQRGLAVIAAVITFAAPSVLGAESPSSGGTGEYSAYKVIPERNIFNAARSGRSSAGPREARRPVRVESFALVGTMSYEKGRYAFFDGSGSEFRKALQVGEVIAGHTIREVRTKSVRLELAGKSIDLGINTQMKREDDGPWRASVRTESYSGTGEGGGAGKSSTPSSSPGSSGSSGDVSEVLKRLMEQREKEMK